MPSESTSDWSVPRLDPNPVVWLEDWEGEEEVPPLRQEAQVLLSRADRLKAAEEFAEAEKNYQRAMEADPAITGFNVGANCGVSAGQKVMHAHIHFIPRRGETPIKGAIRNKMAY